MKRPIRLGLVFFVASVLWIFLSDLAVLALFDAPEAIRMAQTLKGWVYVALATVLVVYLARRELRSVEAERAELETSERRFRRAVEEAPFPAMLHAEDGEILTLSHEWTDITGYTRKEIPTLPDWTSRAYGERKAEVEDHIQSTYELTERQDEGEFRIQVRSGETRVWQFSSVPLGPLPDGRRVVLSMAVDVTERVEREQALAESEARYRNLFDNAPVPLWIFDLKTLEFLAVNQAAVEHYGYTREEFLEMTIEDIRPDADLDALHESVGAVPGLHRAGVWTHLTRDGTPIQVEITSYPITFRGRAAEFIMTIDVTSREEVHEALRRSRLTYEQLFRKSHAVMLVIDPEDGSIVDANPAAEAFYGYAVDEFRTMKIADINTADPRYLATRMEDARSRQVHFFQFQHRLADGSLRDVEVYTGPVQLGDQRVLFSIIHDVSDRAEAKRQLEHAQRMEVLGRLAGGVAHDFNNILAVIGGAAALAAESLPPDSPAHPDLGEIQRASERGASLTGQLLAFSRKQVTRPEVLDLNEALETMADGLRRLAGERIHLSFDLCGGPTPIYIDAGQLEQVVLNLVVNARDAIVGSGSIRIGTRTTPEAERPGQVQMEVEDDGPGVPLDAVDAIFDPFFTTKDVGKGTGLGLSTVFGILREAGGEIELDGGYENGARFVVTLPRVLPSTRIAEPESRAPETFSAQKDAPAHPILLVEDDDALRNVIERMLTRAGYQVIAAASGRDALDAVRSGPAREGLALIISDVVMPDLAGPAMMEAIRDAGCAAPVIFTSGYSPEDAQDLISHFPNSRFVEKPFTADRLLREVRGRLTG